MCFSLKSSVANGKPICNEQETATWEQLGAERSTQNLLALSGSIDLSLARHLVNQTFTAAKVE
ncbi:hypothetical protein BDV23DRAFT_148563 [Aspergillus alliaceus]|uniref:Uncharacterized protein n=1 Tax=Petromyces alliaceus TaxID=209559 RepID=A0A5N7CIW2_PETAA|nr:hypothetical protein BDV23DRAFT_148563 [Aspergillus alliaceus]